MSLYFGLIVPENVFCQKLFLKVYKGQYLKDFCEIVDFKDEVASKYLAEGKYVEFLMQYERKTKTFEKYVEKETYLFSFQMAPRKSGTFFFLGTSDYLPLKFLDPSDIDNQISTLTKEMLESNLSLLGFEGIPISSFVGPSVTKEELSQIRPPDM